MAFVVLSLGSNCGDRLSNIQLASRMLPIMGKVYSCIYESKALLPYGAPISWDIPFLNMAIAGYTNLLPCMFLHHVKKIENFLGKRNKKFWSPRIIDIDIILWDNININTDVLQIPHKYMHCRDFVLVPICDICPRFVHHTFNMSMQAMLLNVTQINLVQRLNIIQVNLVQRFNFTKFILHSLLTKTNLLSRYMTYRDEY
ncbi:2-amino-4-hydroxy-6-hydroxymethyldihydropteridine diphosphokinase [Neoehrlichia mikurensis]|uniref:2-amino-4-hydroxy-6-hydroxymethyldihydropteridine pyrophosphokinase n=1 Tax=Neoehrlichia mikurensis TaxID=89586 RepID=A0A9Q9C0F3_9RICK|nr:2-amino-4-hydroxy-6-hydroxymethyldihydropteridine diphosphokinase [Neoehrlichia mikurensis]QXK91751.1 2-amino-4-hydroxy-6-hydroxymethyldihydropteridine diphosphokinase [Neoehrlichia mikurensis]QXK92963.1 2-amino-4-hydroxy-6-hydroxymethyldihydropteridine diphosphokinase [Neoehrlichia mikurensis]QXK93441.1 2-amino-4-hydroxy-6-hydroxymethyldihydropteridine diphosphokinase [Neoehrlichia mikurensis]UTO55605.1 2-amino-4-hydroxy-6-hydroxymethyldihydropteridine diphosphokinase [Neoehrlichia mikurens